MAKENLPLLPDETIISKIYLVRDKKIISVVALPNFGQVQIINLPKQRFVFGNFSIFVENNFLN